MYQRTGEKSICPPIAKKNHDESIIYSQEYFSYITLAIPFYMFGQVMNPIIRVDGNPRLVMISAPAGAVINIIPVLYIPVSEKEAQDCIDAAKELLAVLA